MPKRDERYMEDKRELIARAALDCLLEKGVHETTVRDVCERVGISMGALYVHYRNREDLFLAALRMEPSRQVTPVSSWEDYIGTTKHFVQRIASVNDHARRRARLSIQFMAEHILEKKSPAGYPELFQFTLGFYRESLRIIHRNAEITLPMGLLRTAQVHQRLESGTVLLMIADKTIDAREATSSLIDALALTAGLTNSSKKRHSRKG